MAECCGQCSNEQDEANAAHIVKCVNLHEELVVALDNAISLNHVAEHRQDRLWVEALALCKSTLNKARQ